MANSSITFYKTAIDPNRNMVIEQMTQYLQTCSSVGPITIMYVKPAMDIHLNIEWPQGAGWIPTKGTYAAVSTEGQTHYYFITKTDWVAQSTVGLELHLDTINSFWTDYRFRFTDRTHITRQHKRRFLKNGAREIDEFDEGITPVLQFAGHYIIGQFTPLWYLIYRSDTTAEDSTVSCYACSKDRYRISTGQSAGTVRWNRGQLTAGYYYYLVPENDIPNPAVAVQYYANPYYTVTASEEKPIIEFFLNSNGYIEVRRFSRSGVADSGYPFNQSYDWIDFVTSRRVYVTTTPSIQIADILAGSVNTVQAGTIGDLYIESIDQLDRTDNQLIKVLELGYAPFEVVVSQGNLQIPSGWSYDSGKGLLKLDSLNTEFLNPNIGTYSTANVEYALDFNVDVNAAPNIYYESKLYNSNFYGLKFTYDAESYVVKPERIRTYSALNYSSYPQFVISYKPSNGINSSCGFKITHQNGNPVTAGYHDGLDYEGVLVSTRNNELPLYNNEYLNYLKYGKQYADRQTGLNVGATWLSTLLSIGGGVAAGAVVGSAPGAIVGGIVGAISGISTAITSTVKAIDSQQQKEWELQHQATNVTGNSDLDIFKWYSNGKLHVFCRQPSTKMQNLLFTLFFRGGYACDDYGVPDLNSRYWFNFIQCTPSFDVKGIQIYQNFLDDIIARYQAGVTIFHCNDGVWTLNYEKENWEVSLISHATQLDASWVSEINMDDDIGFVGKYDGPVSLDGTNLYIEFKWQERDNVVTATSQGTNVSPHTYFEFGTPGQYRYEGSVISWRIVSNDPDYITSGWGSKIV